MTKGNLFLISGPSGSGKDTVLGELLKKHPEISFSISYTTRPMRKGEKQDQKYHHISVEEFETLLQNGEFLEHNYYAGNYYGTAKGPVEECLNNGKDMIIEVDVNGAYNIRKQINFATSLFILPPSFDELKNRLTSRGTEEQEQINKRLTAALDEIERSNEYDYIIVNDNLNEAVKDFENIILTERLKYKNNINLVERVLNKC